MEAPRIGLVLCAFVLASQMSLARSADAFKPVQSVLDFSGLAWLGGDRFVIATTPRPRTNSSAFGSA